MHRASSWSVLLVLVIAIVGCTNPATGTPEAVVEEAAPVAQTPGGARYAVSPDSTIGFVGSKVTGSHDGGFNNFSGEIVYGESIETSSINIVIDTTSLWADDERLTGHLKSPDFFEVETYPQATFSSTAIAAGDDGFTVTGNLDLHGVTKSISFPASIEMAEGSIAADAEFHVKRFDFDLVYPGKADDLIRDEVVIKFHLVALPAS